MDECAADQPRHLVGQIANGSTVKQAGDQTAEGQHHDRAGESEHQTPGRPTVSLLKGDLFGGIASVADDGVKALGGAGTPSGDRVVEMRDFFRFVQAETAAMMDRWQESRR